MVNSYRILWICTAHGRTKTLEISPSSPCRLVAGGLEGFDAPEVDVRLTPYASRAGGYPVRRRFCERELSLTFDVAAAEADAVRRQIVSMLDPMADGELFLDIGGVQRRIAVLPFEESHFRRDTFFDALTVTLVFLAPGIFFRDADDKILPFRDDVPLLTFPFTSMAGAGTVSGFYRTTDRAIADNPGDAVCGVVATLAADGGAVVHPGIQAGEAFIRCPITLEPGDVLVMDTREGMKNITKNGIRTFLFDRDSHFFSLPPGQQPVAVTCDSGAEFVRAHLRFTPLYHGM